MIDVPMFSLLFVSPRSRAVSLHVQEIRPVKSTPISLSFVVLLLLVVSTVSRAQDNWNVPQAPVRIFANTYYVGTAGLSAILITSDGGHILIDGALPQSAPL